MTELSATFKATFKARLVGGPQGGILFETGIMDGEELPKVVNPTDAGAYHLASYSKLPPDTDFTHLFRGAQYEWVEAV